MANLLIVIDVWLKCLSWLIMVGVDWPIVGPNSSNSNSSLYGLPTVFHHYGVHQQRSTIARTSG